MSADFFEGPPEKNVTLSPIQFLRKQTSSLHAQLEASVDIDASLGSISCYRSLLSGYLSVFKPFEEALSSSAYDFYGTVPWRYHNKVSLLERDLLVLGAPDARSEPGPGSRLPKLDDPDSVLGALYVVEGSSLGGQVIYRQIQRRLALDAYSGAAFFFGAGPQTVGAWKEFIAMLEERVSRPQRAASAACAMFQAFRHGLQLIRRPTNGG